MSEQLKNRNGSGRLAILFGILLLVIVLIIYPGWQILNGEITNYAGVSINAVLLIAILFGGIPIALGIWSDRNRRQHQIPRRAQRIGMGILLFLQIAVVTFFNLFYTIKQYLHPPIGFVWPIVSGILTAIGMVALVLFKDRIPFTRRGIDLKQSAGKLMTIALVGMILLPYLQLIAAHPRMTATVPPKPGLVAHRGASFLAPENTIVAGEKALEFPIVGWEVDVVLTADGIPIINHDASSFQRTSNIDKVFPSRAKDAPETFTLAEVKQLDAGSWFVETDPFGTIAAGQVSADWIAKYAGEPIPTLEEVLNFTRDHGLMVYLDIKTLQGLTPYADHFFEIIVDTILASGINLTQIQIEQIDAVRYALLVEKHATEIQCGIDLGPFGSRWSFDRADYVAVS